MHVVRVCHQLQFSFGKSLKEQKVFLPPAAFKNIHSRLGHHVRHIASSLQKFLQIFYTFCNNHKKKTHINKKIFTLFIRQSERKIHSFLLFLCLWQNQSDVATIIFVFG